MDWANKGIIYLNDLTADPAMIELGFSLLMGLAVFSLLAALILLVMGFLDPLRQRLRGLGVHADVTNIGSGAGTVNAGRSTSPASNSVGGGLSQWLGPMGEKLVPSEEDKKHKISQRLRRAGRRSPGAINVFYGVRLALMVLPSLAIITLAIPMLRLSIPLAMLLMVGVAIAGYLAPSFWLDLQLKKRTRLLSRALPDALDLLVVCSEAGLGLTAAIQRVSNELEVSHHDLADELNLFCLQTRAGMDQRQALRDLEDRTGVEDIRGLVTTLIQSMRFGTSVAATLRIYSAELRDKRTQIAEEKAATVSTKMLFPLVLCIFPSFFVIALGPAVLGVMAALSKQ